MSARRPRRSSGGCGAEAEAAFRIHKSGLSIRLEELARIQSTDVVLPLADGSGRELRIRCVVRPDRAQALLLDRLGLRLPDRLRIPPHVNRM